MKNLIRTILLLTFIALTASAIYPCECEIMKPSKKLRKAKAVFVGEVVEIERNYKGERAMVAVKFKVRCFLVKSKICENNVSQKNSSRTSILLFAKVD